MVPVRNKFQNPSEPHNCGQFDTDESQWRSRTVVCCLTGTLEEQMGKAMHYKTAPAYLENPSQSPMFTSTETAASHDYQFYHNN